MFTERIRIKAIGMAIRAFFVMAIASDGPRDCLGQGFFWSNGGGNGGARALIYSPDPGEPSLEKWGNTTNATPPGTQTYAGAALAGTNYSVEAWLSLTPVADPFALTPGARAVAGSLTTFLGTGYFGGAEPVI